MAFVRQVEAELLDHLPAEDPRAQRARRDLRRVNLLMLQAGIMASALVENFPGTPRRIVDLGSGDGMFMLAVARKLARHWPGLEFVPVDQKDIVGAQTRAQFAALGYAVRPVAADIFAFLRNAKSADVFCANLFLHHFEPPQLAKLLSEIAQRATIFVACEPRRAAFPLLASKMLGLVGCAAVARSDAIASVRAGFAGNELTALWPQGGAWQLDERPARLFTHRFVARRGATS